MVAVPSVTLVLGDITAQEVDAVVNAANRSLLGGGGVDGAIHRRGGDAILDACRQLRATTLPDGLPVGEAVATTAGSLPARWVIHTVGPIYGGRPEDAELLASCYRSSLRVGRRARGGERGLPRDLDGCVRLPGRGGRHGGGRRGEGSDDLDARGAVRPVRRQVARRLRVRPRRLAEREPLLASGYR